MRRHLIDAWNADGSRLRERIDAAMHQRAGGRQRAVEGELAKREGADVERAQAIFGRFRTNLKESLRRLEDEDRDAGAQFALFDDQRRQRQRDIARMGERLAQLDDDELREVAGLRARYEDVRPYVTAAALVFAVSEQDAAAWGGRR